MSRAFKIIYFFPYTDRNGKMQIRESSYFGIFPAVKYARNLKHFSRNFFLKCNYFTFLSLFSLRFVFQLSLLLFSSMSSWQLHFFAHQGFWKYCNNPAAELVELTRNWFRYSKLSIRHNGLWLRFTVVTDVDTHPKRIDKILRNTLLLLYLL